MNRLRAAVLISSLLAAAPAGAQQLILEINDGRVTLEATAVPARVILAKWAEIGGTKIVGGDKVPGGPLTLKLVGVPERQALDIILRNAAGFMAAPRLASAAAGASMYDRIMILPTSTPPSGAAASASRGTAAQTAGPGRAGFRQPPRPPNLPPSPAADDADNAEQNAEVQDNADTGAGQRVFTFPAPPGSPAGDPAFVQGTQNGVTVFGRPQVGGVAAPVITLQPNSNGQPTIYNFVPNTDGQPTQPPPAAPGGFGSFGTPQPGQVGSPQPGMIAPAPPQQQQQQQQRPPRQQP